jgi:hypothetical protein
MKKERSTKGDTPFYLSFKATNNRAQNRDLAMDAGREETI